ncbi:MAG: hypothetical protein ACJZ9G_11815 [Rhodospirillales bacterium]
MTPAEVVYPSRTPLIHRYPIESITPAAFTLFSRFVAYMMEWSNASYDTWGKAGRPARNF